MNGNTTTLRPFTRDHYLAQNAAEAAKGHEDLIEKVKLEGTAIKVEKGREHRLFRVTVCAWDRPGFSARSPGA